MTFLKSILESALLVLIAIKPIPTVTSLHTSISLKAKVDFDFESSFSKPIFTSYFDT